MIKGIVGKGEAIKWLLRHVPLTGDECLFWPFSRSTGYGNFSDGGKLYYAHQFMCELVNGPRPTPKHQAGHSCGKGRGGCISPNHLSWKTNSENQLDRQKHGTQQRGAKMTEEQVRIIRELKGLATTTQLAKLCGVTHSTILYIQADRHLSRRSSRLESAPPPAD